MSTSASSMVGRKSYPVVSITFPVHSQYPDNKNDIQHLNALLKQIKAIVVKHHGDVQFMEHPLPVQYQHIALITRY